MSQCTWCEKQLDSEEKENPRKSEDDEIICDSCYEDKYQDRCGYCTEIVDKTELNHFAITQNIVENMFNIPDGTGIYKPLRRPFYYGSILQDEAFFIGAIEKVTELPEDCTDEYGRWICDMCMGKITQVKHRKRSI